MCGKLRVLYSWEAMASAMFEEIFNEYSIGFSAAMARDTSKLMGVTYSKAKTVEDLYKPKDEDAEEFEIMLLC
jgi:hypothetical protein